MRVRVEAGAACGMPEVGVDWDAVDPDNWIDRGLVRAEAMTQDVHACGVDPWLETLETPTPEELDEWFGSDGPHPPALTGTPSEPVTVSAERLAALEAALGSEEAAWLGVNRVVPRPLPGGARGRQFVLHRAR